MGKIFIVGVGRSGTSLLQSMLSSHSQIVFPAESAFIRRYLVGKKLEKLAKKGGDVTEVLENDKKISNIMGELPTEFNNPEGLDLKVYDKIVDFSLKKSGKLIFGDKDPRLVEYLPLIHKCFSDAFVIHILRDPRDVLVSKKKALWSSSRSDIHYAFSNSIQIEEAERHGARLFGNRYLQVRYEDLISDAESELKKILKFLNLEYESGCLNFSEAARKLVRPDELQWKSEIMGELLTSNKNKWERELNPLDIAFCEQACSRAMELGGYKKSKYKAQLKLIERISIYIRFWLIEMAKPLYRLYRSIKAW